MNIFRYTLLVACLCTGILQSDEIRLSSATTATDASTVLPLHCFEQYPQLDEANVKLGLFLMPMVLGKTEKYSWVYSPGTDPLFQIFSPDDRRVRRLVLTVWNWFGEPVLVRPLQPGRVEDIRLSIEGFGTWMMTLDAYQGPAADTLVSRLTRSFCVAPDSSGKRKAWLDENRYVLGSCFFPQRYFQWKGWGYPDLTPQQAIEKMVSLAARAGFSMLRIDSFPDGSPARWKSIDETVRTLKEYGITPDWKIELSANLFEGDSLKFDPLKFGVFEKQIDALLERYGSGSMIELGNEPVHHEFWGGSVEQYIHLYRTLYHKVRSYAPNAQVMHGGACFPGADSWFLKDKDPAAFREKEAVQEVLYDRLHEALGSLGSFWPYHWHGAITAEDYHRVGGMLRRLEAAENPLQMFQTEGGACAWRPDFEAATWVSIIQKFFISWANGDRGWLQFALAGQPTDVRTDGRIEGWCLLQSGTFAPRFQYGAWAAVTDWFAGCRLEQRVVPAGPDDPLNFVYVFDHPDGKIVSCFSEDSTPTELKLWSDARQVLRIDPMGNAVEEPDTNPAVVLKKYPQYILLKGATSTRIQMGFEKSGKVLNTGFGELSKWKNLPDAQPIVRFK